MPTNFDTPSNTAYVAQGVLPAGQRWFAFDVPMRAAILGKASRFVMTLWDNKILLDSSSRTYWYKVPRREPDGSAMRNRTSLCNALRIADAKHLTMTGILKDRAEKHRCSMKHLFTIDAVFESDIDDAIWLHISPRDPADIGCDATVQKIAKAQNIVVQLANLHRRFEAQVNAACVDREARLKRLNDAPKQPRRILVNTTVFERNPDVVAEVLYRAAGKCGYCGKEAPFLKKSNGAPYLEVHHKNRLADNGEDTVDNAIAVCPNCHREKHYG